MKVKDGALGLIDDDLVSVATERGINLLGGYVRNTDRRVVIGNRLFLEMGMKHRYVMRSRIVWWLKTGEFLRGNGIDIHHKNHDRIDDRFENLERIEHGDHAREHNPRTAESVERICKECGKLFLILRHRLKEAGRGSYCSYACYGKTAKPWLYKRVDKVCEYCGIGFVVIEAKTHRRFCSQACSANARWAKEKSCEFA